MSRYQRLTTLLELLAAAGHVSVDEAAEQLAVSPATVRRDLDSLAGQRLLTRTHGGAVSNGTSYELPLRYRSVRRAEQKVRIARCAAELVAPGSVVGLNGGTTSTEVARALATRADLLGGGDSARITVVTNALNIASELTVRGHIKLVVLGGVPRPQSYELIGPFSLPVLSQLRLDLAIIGVDALDVAHGASSHNEAEAEINARIAGQARRIALVADSSKLGRAAFAQIVRADQVQLLITDTEAEPGLVTELVGCGIEVIQA
ncbi:MAG: DeoR/GlpR family DNA-binding transcription regulator [Jatrophihabitans sp.]